MTILPARNERHIIIIIVIIIIVVINGHFARCTPQHKCQFSIRFSTGPCMSAITKPYALVLLKIFKFQVVNIRYVHVLKAFLYTNTCGFDPHN